MGAQTSTPQQLAIIKNRDFKQQKSQRQFNIIYQSPDLLKCNLFNSFDQFIQKQSLKNLNYVLIIQNEKQYNQKDKVKLKKKIPQYLFELDKIFDKKSHSAQKQLNRTKLINYIKKYSLDYLNVYVHVEKLSNTVISQSEMSYITIVSESIDKIRHYILNQQKQKMINVKFKRLVKDLYRRKLVVVISKDYKQQSKKSKSKSQKPQPHKNPQLEKLQTCFKQNKFSYEMVPSINQLWKRIKSMLPQFIICLDQQNILQLIQFKKTISLQSKIIYYGQHQDLRSKHNFNGIFNQISLLSQKDPIYQKKIKEIWWVSNDITNQIEPVMKQWETAIIKQGINQQITTNVVLVVHQCQHIVRKQYIIKRIKDKLKLKTKKPINFTIQYRNQQIFKRVTQSLYTIILIYDITAEQFQQMKRLILIQKNCGSRVQITLIQKQQQNHHQLDNQQIKKEQDIIIQNLIDQVSEPKQLQFKFEILPIETINCFQLQQQQHNYFQYKMGLQVIRILKEQIKDYFPQIKQDKICLKKIFQNFYIVCNLTNYQQYILPQLTFLKYYDKQQRVFRIQENLSKQMQQYYNKLKIIIYNDIDLQNLSNKTRTLNNPVSLNYFYDRHHSGASLKQYISMIAENWLRRKQKQEANDQIKNDNSKNKRKNLVQNKEQRAKQKAIKFKEDLGIFVEKIIARILQNQKIQNYQTKKQFNISNTNKKNQNKYYEIDNVANNYDTVQQNENNFKQSQVFKLPGVELAHFRLDEIEQYLSFSQCSKISFTSFPKQSIKRMYQSSHKIQNLLQSKSFSIQATFISDNDLMKKIFQQKQIKVSNKHQMELIKFNQSKVNQISYFQQYIEAFSGLWKLKFKLNNAESEEVMIKNLDIIKNDIKRAFYKCRNYDLLKITTTQFKHFYIDKIDDCKTLLDLQIAAIYIYSLPHGMSQIVNALFKEPLRSTLAVQIFCSFIFALFLNFFSFQYDSIVKYETVIYVDDRKIQDLYQNASQSSIIFNKNFLHCLHNQNSAQNQKNNCIFISYQHIPLNNKSYISTMLNIQRFAFYKESAQFLIAPFTKLQLNKKEIVDKKYKLYFDVVHSQKVNIYLNGLFKLNQINQQNLFQFFSHNNQNSANSQQSNTNQDSQYDDLSSFNSKQNDIQRQIQRRDEKYFQIQQKKTQQMSKGQSLYRLAQSLALQQQKTNVQRSIEVGLQYSSFLRKLHQKKYFTSRHHLFQTFIQMKKQIINLDKNQDESHEEWELEKMRIQKSMLYYKMCDFSKAIAQLTKLLEFMEFQKIEDRDNWLQDHLKKTKLFFQSEFKQRRNAIQKFKATKKWTISMNHQQQKPILPNKKKSKQPTQKQKEIQKRQSVLPKIDQKGKESEQKQTQNQKQKYKMVCNIKSSTKKWQVTYCPKKQTFYMQSKSCQQNSSVQSTQQKIDIFEQHKNQPTKQQFIADIFSGLIKDINKEKNQKQDKAFDIMNASNWANDHLQQHINDNKETIANVFVKFNQFYKWITQRTHSQHHSLQPLDFIFLRQFYAEYYQKEDFNNLFEKRINEFIAQKKKFYKKSFNKQSQDKNDQNKKDKNSKDHVLKTDWIDQALGIQKKKQWYVFQFDGKVKIAQANRKFKQKIGIAPKNQWIRDRSLIRQ